MLEPVTTQPAVCRRHIDFLMDESMDTGQRTIETSLDAFELGSTPRTSSSEAAELATLRADNARLREQLALRDLALDAIQTTFVIADRTTLEPTIIYCNKIVADMVGLRCDDVIGRGISLISQRSVSGQPDFRKDFATLSAGRNVAYESEFKRTDGSTFWRGITVIPIFDADGALIRSVAMGADITAKREAARQKQDLQDRLVRELKERERLLAELHLAQKLESVGRLAAGIAHEINTPIQYIGDSIDFLKNGCADINQVLDGCMRALTNLPDPQGGEMRTRIDNLAAQYELEYLRAEIPKAFESMSEGVARISNIVNAMKEFAHPDTSEHSAADINHAIRSTLIVATNVYKFVARVHTEFADLPDVLCNIGELNQVFLNLVINAAHAIEDAARDVSTGAIKICTTRADDAVEICVSDNGCGIPPENLSKLYDPFFTTKEVGRGAGQGLAVARSIVVDKHGGDVRVSSTVGVGTQFTLRLPIGRVSGTQP